MLKLDDQNEIKDLEVVNVKISEDEDEYFCDDRDENDDDDSTDKFSENGNYESSDNESSYWFDLCQECEYW